MMSVAPTNAGKLVALALVFVRCTTYRSTQNISFVVEILDFATLRRVHVYRIEYVLYRQGPYRIRIVSAADSIVPALVSRGGQNTDSTQDDCVVVLSGNF